MIESPERPSPRPSPGRSQPPPPVREPQDEPGLGPPPVDDPLMAIDQLGHLAIASLVGDQWVTYLAWPEIDFTPKLISRQIVEISTAPPASTSEFSSNSRTMQMPR